MSGLSPAPNKTPLLSDSKYNALKHSVTLILPAASTLYFALSQIWHLPRTEEVVGSIAALNAFLGVIIGISTKSYNNSGAKYDGIINVTDDGAKKVVSLEIDGDPNDIDTMETVTFKVNTDTGGHPIIKP